MVDDGRGEHRHRWLFDDAVHPRVAIQSLRLPLSSLPPPHGPSLPPSLHIAVTVVAAMAAMMLPETGGKGLGAMNDSKEVEMEERALEDSMEGRPESQGGRTAAQKEGGQAVVVAIDQAGGGGPAEEK